MVHKHETDNAVLAPAYAGRLSTSPIPKHRLPDSETAPDAVQQLSHDDLLPSTADCSETSAASSARSAAKRTTALIASSSRPGTSRPPSMRQIVRSSLIASRRRSSR